MLLCPFFFKYGNPSVTFFLSAQKQTKLVFTVTALNGELPFEFPSYDTNDGKERTLQLPDCTVLTNTQINPTFYNHEFLTQKSFLVI